MWQIQKSRDHLKPFVIPNESFHLGKQIGSGSYGAVYSSKIRDFRCIAKRMLDILVGRGGEERVSEKEKARMVSNFQRECTILSTARHPNVVQFMGVHYGSDKYDISLIMEHLPSDLENLLKHCGEEHANFKLPLSFQISLLSDISSGLLYLHSQSIVHRDLNAGNVLLTNDLQAKIADLGVSKLCSDKKWFQKLTKVPGAQGYMPPEARSDNPVYNEKIDVFSFGVLSLYIAIQEYPEFSVAVHVPDKVHEKGEDELFKRQKWLDQIVAENHPFLELVRQCLLDQQRRIETSKVVEIVQKMHDVHPCTILQTLDVFAYFHDILNN